MQIILICKLLANLYFVKSFAMNGAHKPLERFQFACFELFGHFKEFSLGLNYIYNYSTVLFTSPSIVDFVLAVF